MQILLPGIARGSQTPVQHSSALSHVLFTGLQATNPQVFAPPPTSGGRHDPSQQSADALQVSPMGAQIVAGRQVFGPSPTSGGRQVPSQQSAALWHVEPAPLQQAALAAPGRTSHVSALQHLRLPPVVHP
jgi:hypothetical protein